MKNQMHAFINSNANIFQNFSANSDTNFEKQMINIENRKDNTTSGRRAATVACDRHQLVACNNCGVFKPLAKKLLAMEMSAPVRV